MGGGGTGKVKDVGEQGEKWWLGGGGVYREDEGCECAGREGLGGVQDR